MLLDKFLEFNEELLLASQEDPKKFTEVMDALSSIYAAITLLADKKVLEVDEIFQQLLEQESINGDIGEA